jgi:hypothetical protein
MLAAIGKPQTISKNQHDDRLAFTPTQSGMIQVSVRDTTEIVFGDEIVSWQEQADGVEVQFRKPKARRFSLVIGAAAPRASPTCAVTARQASLAPLQSQRRASVRLCFEFSGAEIGDRKIEARVHLPIGLL